MSTAKILLVDDLEENLLALEMILREEGVELLQARSAREALELLLVHDFALALVDVQMPEMGGFELAELMRGAERTRHVPIIFVTAGIQDRLRIFQGYDSGAVDFLLKPIEPRILQHKARVFLGLHRQRQRLQDTLRLNEELLAVVSHDLRNPLGAVLMSAEVLAGSSDPMAAEVATSIHSSGTRMQRILDDLFDLSRARLAGGIPIDRRSTDISSVTMKAVAELQTTHPERELTVRFHGDTRGEWDASRVAQIVSNLVGNALRHGKANTPIDVVVDGSAAEAVTLSVHNQGHISPELLPRMFEPFQQGKGRIARSKGLGLGLYIIQQIARAHEGDVTVESTESAGTTFRVTLPRHCAAR